MLRRHRIMIGAILLLVCLSGCHHTGTSTAPLHDVLERSAEPEPVHKIETVGMYIDVTTSMKGFLNNPDSNDDSDDDTSDNDTLYSLCLSTLSSLLSSKYDQIKYYRVDTPLWRVDEPETVLALARDESYYEDSKKLADAGRAYADMSEGSPILEGKDYPNRYDIPCLTVALEDGRSHDLFILITDLYENSTGKDTNASLLAGEIRKLAGLDDGKVFGLIGIKSAFCGDIYDTGPDGKTVKHYEGYRSFYILLRGYPEHVRDFCQSMEAGLKDSGARQGEDYEITVFDQESFVPLDYTSYKECANDSVTNSNRKKSLWLDDTVVAVSDARGQAGNVELPVYGYRKNTADKFGGILYFTYSIDRARQEQFHTLVEGIEEKTVVDFLPGGETELYELPCSARELTVSCWDEEKGVFEEHQESFFEVCGLYYSQDTETLYAGLRLEDKLLAQGLWRLQWKNVLEESEMTSNPWWETWYTPSVGEVDYSKTERLLDYATPILEKASGTEQSVLNAVVYLAIETG